MTRKHGRAQSPWFLMDGPDPAARLRIFCFPFAGGGASVYSGWRDAFPSDVQVCPVQYPGRENRLSEEPIQEMGILVNRLFGEVKPLLDRPFLFFGHSMGAQVAFELAALIQKRLGMEPLHFFASGCHAPHLKTPPPLMSGLTDEVFLSRISDYGGTPEAVLRDEALTRLVLPVLRADFFMTESYRTDVSGPLHCPMTALCGSEDYRYHEDLIRPWLKHTRGPFEFHVVSGGHFFVRSARQAVITRVLARIPERERVAT